MVEYNENENISKKYMYELNEIKYNYVIYLNNIGDTRVGKYLSFKSQEIENFNSDFELLGKYCSREIIGGKTIILCLSKERQLKSLEPFLNSYHVVTNDNFIEREINILYKKFNNGFVFENYVVIAESDIEKVKNNSSIDIKYTELPKFPAVERDIAFVISDNVLSSEIVKEINSSFSEVIDIPYIYSDIKMKYDVYGAQNVLLS